MAALQLPAKYPQLPALLIGQIETLIWRLEIRYKFSKLLVLGITPRYHSKDQDPLFECQL